MARLCLSPAARTTADATKRSLKVGFGILIFSTSAALSLLTIRGRSQITSAAGGGEGVWQMMTIAGEGGVSQKLTIADKRGCGSEKFSTKGFYMNQKYG